MKTSAVFLKEILAVQTAPLKTGTERLLRTKDPEALHKVRVDVLRAKFALKLLRTYAGEDQKKMVHNRLKKYQNIMGEARNLDILLVRLDKDFQNLGLDLAKKRAIRRQALARRDQAWKDMLKALNAGGFNRVLEQLRLLAQVCGDKAVTVKEAQSTSRRILRDCAQAVLKWKKKAKTPADLHKVRIAFKELRYACEFFGDFYKGMRKGTDAVVQFQDVLGDRQDAVGTIDRLKHLKRDVMPPNAGIPKIIAAEKRFGRDKHRQFNKLWKRRPINRLKFDV